MLTTLHEYMMTWMLGAGIRIIRICGFIVCIDVYVLEGLLAEHWAHPSIILFFKLIVRKLYLTFEL